MDLSDIKSAVLRQLSEKTGIDSLKIQNHIYGCFIVMEDIAQQHIAFSNNIISNGKFIFDLDKQFSEIGIRYGFIMDTKLLFHDYEKLYKDMWIKYFNIVHHSHNIEQADTIEDALIEIIQSQVPSNEAFFINSLESGTLSQEWIDKVISLFNTLPSSSILSVEQSILDKDSTETHATYLTTVPILSQVNNTQNTQNESEIQKSEDVENVSDRNTISKAITEKPIKTRRVVTTKRSNKPYMNNPVKKILARTRRRR